MYLKLFVLEGINHIFLAIWGSALSQFIIVDKLAFV